MVLDGDANKLLADSMKILKALKTLGVYKKEDWELSLLLNSLILTESPNLMFSKDKRKMIEFKRSKSVSENNAKTLNHLFLRMLPENKPSNSKTPLNLTMLDSKSKLPKDKERPEVNSIFGEFLALKLTTHLFLETELLPVLLSKIPRKSSNLDVEIALETMMICFK